ncbi:MAG: hypothetical protein IJT49_01870 [Clostridia bacterium]|nr:hypothetical protein [Clostridia bacterium]
MAILKMSFAAFRAGKRSIPSVALCVAAATALISFIFCVAVEFYKFGVFDANGDKTELIQTFTFTFLLSSAVIAAGCAIICAALSVCYNRNIHLLGVFSSCGADGGQKTAVLCFEAAIYAFLSAPLGTVFGAFSSDKFCKFVFPALNKGYVYAFSYTTAVVSFFVAVAAVVISSLIPAAKFSRENVIPALKDGTKINISLRKSLASRVLPRLFGYKGKLSGQLYTNEKSKNNTLIFGAVFSEFLFVFLYSSLVYDAQKGQTGGKAPYQTPAFPYIAAVCAFVFVLCAVSALCASAASSYEHKSDYATLRSVGASLYDLSALSALSSLYLFINLTVWTLAATVLSDLAMYIIYSFGAFVMFAFPFEALLICAAANAALCVLSFVYTTVTIRKTPVLSGLKREF